MSRNIPLRCRCGQVQGEARAGRTYARLTCHCADCQAYARFLATPGVVDAAVAIAPGIESPTVSPLQNPDWVAVRAMVPRKDVNRVMDELYAVGARAILVSSLLACRL